MKPIPYGAIVSADLTVDLPKDLQDFYAAVAGWQFESLEMTDGESSYDDYVSKDVDGNWVGGLCHSRGANTGIPPQWIIYINVPDVSAGVKSCIAKGGSVVKEARGSDGSLHYAIIQDPLGTVFGLTSVKQ